jgi:thiamine biosynthesis protein ThiI
MNVVIRYHEIALKGRNRPFFIDRLVQSLRQAFSDFPGTVVRAGDGRIAVELPDAVGWEPARERLANVFGIANFSPAYVLPRDLEAVTARAREALAGKTGSFRVSAKRSDKTYPKVSMEIEREVGGALKQATGLEVDLDDPDHVVYLEVLRDRILYSTEKHPGAGGFAVGSSGRVAALLSGGIDSPVAAWRMMKRGCRVLFVHFHAFPLQDRTTIDKTRALARVLTRYQYRSRLVLVPFGPVQQTIVAACPAPLRVVLYRRFMVRIAETIAGRHKAKALVTGESLAQVASQTLDNMAVIDEAAVGPILRPLVGMDKEEITREARRVGSFEISTLPDQDCCQLFVPRRPATAARIEEVRQAETALDVAGLIAQALAGIEEETFVFPAVTADTHPPEEGLGLR